MMLKSMLLTTLLFTALVGTSHAELALDKNDPALMIAGVTVTEVEPISDAFTDLIELPKQPTAPTAPTIPATPIGEVISIIDGIIAIGQKIWPIIDAGRPVINTKLGSAISIIPHMEGENGVLNLMANWSLPVIKSYRVSFKNSLGGEVVGFTYSIVFQYNGNLNGVGKYIASLKVQASQIYAAWGFSFDALSELNGISNIGTKESPIAGGIIQVSFNVKGLLNETRGSQSFFVDGNGHFQVLKN
jgi:hypothetical protein